MNQKMAAQTIRDLSERRERVAEEIARIYERLPGHISDHDLERYHLGMVKDEAELAHLEEHLLWCEACVDRAEAAAQYVDTVRGAACILPD
jgi:chorismate mutase